MRGDWRLAILAIHILASAGLLMSGGVPQDFPETVFYGVILALMTAPLLPLCLWSSHTKVNGAAAIVIGGGGLWMIIDVMYFQPPDGQSALVFLFVPVMQIMAVAVFGVVFAIILRLSRNQDGAGQ